MTTSHKSTSSSSHSNAAGLGQHLHGRGQGPGPDLVYDRMAVAMLARRELAGFYAGVHHGVVRGGTCAVSGGGASAVA